MQPVCRTFDVQPAIGAENATSQYPDPPPPPEVVTGATVVGVGDPPLVFAGGVVDLLPQPVSAATPIMTSARAVSLRFAIVDLR
jgi:hypothetical protein